MPKGITIDNTKAIKLKESWQILYRTQNSVGEPEATVTTVMIPKNANKQKLFTFSFFSVCGMIVLLRCSHSQFAGCALQWVTNYKGGANLATKD